MLQGKYNPHQPKELEQLVTDTLTVRVVFYFMYDSIARVYFVIIRAS
jgi:hypothetical protein